MHSRDSAVARNISRMVFSDDVARIRVLPGSIVFRLVAERFRGSARSRHHGCSSAHLPTSNLLSLSTPVAAYALVALASKDVKLC
jgi:hypothetical protein